MNKPVCTWGYNCISYIRSVSIHFFFLCVTINNAIPSRESITFPAKEFVAHHLLPSLSKKIFEVTSKKPETDSENVVRRQKECPKRVEMENGKFWLHSGSVELPKIF